MKRAVLYALIFFLFNLLGCSGGNRQENAATPKESYINEMTVQASADVRGPMELPGQKLIRNGRVEYETDDLAAARKTILDAVAKHKGYISNDQEFSSPGRKSNTLTIRVDATRFDALMSDATAGVKQFDVKEVNVTDVTEEFVDAEARLATKKELEKRYTELLKKANTVGEILGIEKQLGEVRAEIESVEGRLKYLQNQVAYSTLSVTVYESVPRLTGFGQKFRDGFRNGWDNLIWFFVFLVNIWPFILLGVSLFFGLRIYRRRRKRNSAGLNGY